MVDGGVIALVATSIGRAATAKEVEGLSRRFELVEPEVLRYEVQLAAAGQPLQGHLTAELRRLVEELDHPGGAVAGGPPLLHRLPGDAALPGHQRRRRRAAQRRQRHGRRHRRQPRPRRGRPLHLRDRGRLLRLVWDGAPPRLQRFRPGTGGGHAGGGAGAAGGSGPAATMPRTGPLPITVPGAVDAWFSLLERFGTRSFAAVAEPAIAYASDGFPLTAAGAARIRAGRPRRAWLGGLGRRLRPGRAGEPAAPARPRPDAPGRGRGRPRRLLPGRPRRRGGAPTSATRRAARPPTISPPTRGSGSSRSRGATGI